MRGPVSNGLTALASLLLIVTIGLVVLWALQRRLIYFPLSGVPAPAAVGLSNAEDVSFTADDGVVLHGWFVPPPSGATGVTAIVFNGNAGHRGFRAPLAAMLSRIGAATLLFDYRGYGENAGEPSEEGLARDARAAYRYVAGRRDVDATRMVYYGESLGAAVAIRLATEQPPRALIVRSPFTSLVEVGRHHYPFLPVAMILRDRYPSIERIRDLACPLLVVTADHDSVVPSEQSRRLYEAAPSPKRLVVIDGVDHNDSELVAGARLETELRRFLQ